MWLAKKNSRERFARGCLCALLSIILQLATAPAEATESSFGNDEAIPAESATSDLSAPDASDPMAVSEADQKAVNALIHELSSGESTASRVTEVHAVALEAGTLIEILGDGRFSRVEDFVIENPTRLVVDLPGLSSDVEIDRLVVESPHASLVRVGEHSDKVRVVVDAGEIDDAFGERQILPGEEGVMIVIGSGVALGDPGKAVVETGEPADGANEALAESVAQLSDAIDSTEVTLDLGALTAPAPAKAEMSAQAQTPAQTEMPATSAATLPNPPPPLASPGQPVSLALAPQADTAEAERASQDSATQSAGLEITQRVAEQAQANAGPASPARTPEVRKPMPLATTVYGVEYEANTLRDRIVVVGERVLEYRTYVPDAETFVLSLEGAAIDPDAAVRITPESPGPVSLVTAFEQPDVARPEVRVVVKRASGLTPEISRQGTSILLDFPRGGTAAVTPPVLRMEPPEPAPSRLRAADAANTRPASPMTTSAIGPAIRPEKSRDVRVAPAARAPIAPASPELPAAPAALDPPAAISILNEGGLMDGKEYVGRRISLDFKDVPIDDVLRLIAEVSDLNVIAGDEVDGNVTVRLVDVPWDQALDVVLLTHGLGFVRVGNVLRIAPTSSLAEEEELRLQERRARERLEDLMVKLQPVNYADVKKVSSMVGQLLTPRGTVNVDERTNTLIIKDIPSVIDEATALVKAVDTMTPQVMIEAKIVEADLDFSRELGSKWGFGTNALTESQIGGRDFTPFPGAESNVLSNVLGTNGSGVMFGNPITATSTGLMNMAAHVFDEKFNVELQLQAAESNGDGKVISSPRIVTLDNSEASIEQGVSIPFQTFENGDAQLEFVDAVLQLKVTPHITADQSIIMDIEVSRNAPTDSVPTLTGSPSISKNQVKTETLVKDGQTLVLGGIYVIEKSERESRVPYLHTIPLLGAAFKSKASKDNRKELLIFVTPRVIETRDAAS